MTNATCMHACVGNSIRIGYNHNYISNVELRLVRLPLSLYLLYFATFSAVHLCIFLLSFLIFMIVVVVVVVVVVVM